MKLYKSAKEIENAGICHRNSVPRRIADGRIIKVYSHFVYKKGNRFLGYAVRSELLKL